jgi:hypothetical protein
MSMRPVPGVPIGDYFSSLLEIQNQIVRSSEAISDVAFRTYIFSSLPPVFEVMGKILQNRADASIEEIIDALKEDKRIRAMRTQRAATMDVYYSSSSNRGSGQSQGRGQGASYGGVHNKENRWCNICPMSTYNTEKYYFKAEPSNKYHHDTSEDDTHYYCGGSRHQSPVCPIRKRGKAMCEEAKCTRTMLGSMNFTSADGEASNSTRY